MKRIITDYFSGHSKRGKVQTDETPSVPQVSALDSTTTSTVPDSTGTSANCDTAPIAQASCTTSSVATEKPDDNKKTFQLNWLQKWPWLKKMNTGPKAAMMFKFSLPFLSIMLCNCTTVETSIM